MMLAEAVFSCVKSSLRKWIGKSKSTCEVLVFSEEVFRETRFNEKARGEQGIVYLQGYLAQ